MVLASIRLKGETSHRNIIGLSKSKIMQDYPNSEHCHFVCENIQLSKHILTKNNDL